MIPAGRINHFLHLSCCDAYLYAFLHSGIKMPLPLLKDSRLHPAVIRDKAALAFDGINISLAFQLRIRPLDGIGIDGQLRGKAAHRWQLRVLRQGTLKHQLPKPLSHLLIQRPAVPVIQYNHAFLPPFWKIIASTVLIILIQSSLNID